MLPGLCSITVFNRQEVFSRVGIVPHRYEINNNNKTNDRKGGEREREREREREERERKR